jgi:hypothetical protein
MTQEIIDRVLSLDSADLDPIVQAVLNDSSATATGDLNCEPVAGLSAGVGTLAILKVGGEASTSSGSKKWSVVIKAINTVSQSELGDEQIFEITAYDSGLLDDANAGMRAARCYRIDRLPGGEVWLWIEDLSGWLGPPWNSSDYERAAHDVGIRSGHWASREIPSALKMGIDRTISRFTWESIGKALLRIDTASETVSLLKRVLPESSYLAVQKLATAVELARSAVEAGPRTLVHGDCHPRNMFLSPSDAARQETVAFDWATIGTDHIGADMGTMIGSGMSWHEDEFRMLLDSEHQFYQAFLDGLILGGWNGDSDLARISYLYVVCGYGMPTAMGAVNLSEQLRFHDHFVERSGEPTPEAAFNAYASRFERMLPLAEELIALVR